MPEMKYFLATIEGKRTLINYKGEIPKGVDAKEITIQTDKNGLRDALQELLGEADEAKALATRGVTQIIDDGTSVTEVTPMPAKPQPVVVASITAAQVQEFILDHASTFQVENIFACLGTRFSEMRKEIISKG